VNKKIVSLCIDIAKSKKELMELLTDAKKQGHLTHREWYAIYSRTKWMRPKAVKRWFESAYKFQS